MKRLIFFILLLLCFGQANAQSGQTMVTLKNGTEITGVVKSIDPADGLVITIGSVDMPIKMSDVAKIEAISENVYGNITNYTDQNQNKDKIVVTDNAVYPESFDLKIGDETLKMILVRGGDLNMGFDGRHSISMNSEPVHKVGVTSFYISETFVPYSVVSVVRGKKKQEGYYYAVWKKANEIANKIADYVGLPVRLPLEAEWEYAACSNKQDVLFEECNFYEYCKDFFEEEFTDLEYKIDPTGPKKEGSGKHVVRAYKQKRGKFRRLGLSSYLYYFRLVIKAKDIKTGL